MSRDFASNSDVDTLAQIAVRHIESVFDSKALLLLPDTDKQLQAHGSQDASARLTEQELTVARWAYDHAQEAGLGTQTLPRRAGWLPAAADATRENRGFGRVSVRTRAGGIT
ncbi:MAG: hypothetical protein H6671_04085 [Anaerolineaceae bacterium]|nr:hypothetical protein [Anaerolineaceae bacterium]